MPKKNATDKGEGKRTRSAKYGDLTPHGPRIAEFLKSRGFSSTEITVTAAAEAISKNRKKPMIRQRLSKIIRSDRVRESTLKEIAQAFGSTVEDVLGMQQAEQNNATQQEVSR